MADEKEIRSLLEKIERNGVEGTAKLADLEKHQSDLLKRMEAVETREKSRVIPAVSLPGVEDATHNGRKFSVARAIAAIATKNWGGAELEFEAFRQAARASGAPIDDKGDGARVMLTTSDVSAGYLVPNQIQSGIIEKKYSATVVREMGATILPGLSGSPVEFYKHTGGVSGGYIGEGEDINSLNEDLTFGRIQMTPKRAYGLVKVSNRQLRQATPGLDALINDDLGKALARIQDLAALRGTGASGQPLGISNFPARNDVDMGSPDGGEITYDKLCDLVYELELDNMLEGRLGFVFHPALRNKLAKLLDGDDRPLFQWDPSVAQPTKMLIGYPWKTTTAIPINGTKGNGTALTSIYFANWADLMIGEWGGLMLDASREAGDAFTKDLTFVRILSDFDVAPRHEESFVVSDEVETT